MFGIPPATLSTTLHQAERALDISLKRMAQAAIRWPTFEEQHQWANRLQTKYPALEGRWGFLDGKNYKVQKPTDADKQNAQYNGLII
jgi:hypothetical protein